MSESIPCVLFEDEHLLVVNKPAGLNTHAASPYQGEGIYDWLREREPRWSNLAIIHRLDKETSGVLVFSKTSLANRSLTTQFTQHTIRKTYLLLTDRALKKERFTAISTLVRAGERYLSRPLHASGERAETRFEISERIHSAWLVKAYPITGRTHQIRVHAAEHGFPIMGDSLYAGAAAPRLMLHAEEIILKHPATNAEMRFTAPVDFFADARALLRAALLDRNRTNAYRLIHGASDGWPGWYVDRLAGYLLSLSEGTLTASQGEVLRECTSRFASTGVYHKRLLRQIGRSNSIDKSPELILGRAAPEFFAIRENSLQFQLSFNEGYSVGLFLDQRENRRRVLANYVSRNFPLFTPGSEPRHVLNVFAYTCGFSVCAALVQARVTSIDLSKKYLDWGKRNFVLNGVDPGQHDFIYGDAFDWLKRLAKKDRHFDLIILDPPTFSRAKSGGVFRAEKDYTKLVRAALPVLRSGGVLFASTNASSISPDMFVTTISGAIEQANRRIIQKHYVPQAPDFPISRFEPAYLKTIWLRVE